MPALRRLIRRASSMPIASRAIGWLMASRLWRTAPFAPDQVNKKTIKDLNWLLCRYVHNARAGSLADCRRWYLYMTGSWSVVYAVDAKTAKKFGLMTLKCRAIGRAKACCDVVNRGVAVYDGAVYVASLDGYLIFSQCRNRRRNLARQHDYRSHPRLHHHWRAARCQWSRVYRQWRRRIWRARLCDRL